MHQSFVNNAPHSPPMGIGGGQRGSDLLSFPNVPGKCCAGDITQIYPLGIYYYKEQGYDSAGPHSARLLAGLLWMKSHCPRYSP